MTLPSKSALFLTLSVAVALTACKPKPGEPTAEQQAAAAAAAGTPAPAAAPVVAPAPAAAPADNAAAIAELDKIAVIAKPLPPFPFLDYPASVGEAFQGTDESDFDQVHVVVGNKLHTVEGRTRLIHFSLDDAKLSEFQVKRDYSKAVLDMGGVKVNTVLPGDEAFYAANALAGDTDVLQKKRWEVEKKLGYASNLSYDAYFLPTATGRKWIVLMVNDSKVRLFSIEEKTAASAAKVVAPAA